MMEAGAFRGVQAAIDFLVEANIFGFAWLDGALVVRWRFGGLAEWLPEGENICKTAPLFFGLEKDLLDLQDEHGAVLALPRVGFRDFPGAPGEGAAKISVEVFWDDRLESYLMVMSRLHPESDIEFELVKQVRARRLAEDKYNKARALTVEKQSLLDAIMDCAPAPFAMFDDCLRYIFSTRRWAQEFGLEQHSLAGQSHLFALGLPSDEIARRENCLSGCPAVSGVEELALESGERRRLQWRHEPWRRGDGSVGGIITFARDLTDVMERLKAVEDQNARLARINRELEAFASILAHDLNAPVRAIRARANKAGERVRGIGDAGLADDLDAIEFQAARVAAIISELFDYAVAGAKAAPPAVDPKELVRVVIASTSGADAFEFRYEGEWPQTIGIPAAPLDLVLRNLVQNAVKHHDRERGVVVLGLRDLGDCWLFTVADDGPGIAPAVFKAVLEPFRGPDSGSGRPGGAGLALVKRTVKNYGGAIDLCSDPLKTRGTIFKVTWPKSGGLAVERTL